MAEKDIVEKTLEAYNDVFADIVNVLLFNGEEKVTEDSLTDATTSSYYKIDEKVKTQERDVAKFWNKDNKSANVRIAIFGLENQTAIDYKMPLRVLNYDGANYREQLKSQGKIYPVITLVLYFGYKKRWKTHKTLVECFKNLDEDLKPFVSDYKINVFEIAFLSDETIAKFKSDFRFVAQYFKAMAENKEYIAPKEVIKHVHEILDLMKILTKNDKFNETYNENIIELEDKTDGGVTMFDIFEDYEKRGERKGYALGDKNGFSRGEPQWRNAEKMDTLKRMYNAKFSIPQMVISTGLEESVITKYIDEMKKESVSGQ